MTQGTLELENTIVLYHDVMICHKKDRDDIVPISLVSRLMYLGVNLKTLINDKGVDVNEGRFHLSN